MVLFETARGDRPVAEFVHSLSEKTVAKVAQGIDLLKRHGNLVRMPHSKLVTKDLYELRIRGKEEVRILYTFKDKRIYLLHGFKKKTQKTPRKQIKVAKERIDLI